MAFEYFVSGPGCSMMGTLSPLVTSISIESDAEKMLSICQLS